MSGTQVLEQNQGDYCKVRLFGKKVTADEARRYIVDKVTNGVKITHIAKEHNMTTKTVYRYLEWAQQLKEITKVGDKWSRDVIAQRAQEFQEWNSSHPITSNHLVEEWILDMQTRKDGNAIVLLKSHVNYLERLCNYLKINPEQLTFSKDRQTVKNYMKTFKTMLESGVTEHRPKKTKPDGSPNFDYIFKGYKDSIRSFVAFHGISLPKGEGGVLANKVIGHGKFADIKLTEEELLKADEYLLQKYGADSAIYLLFWVGVESCARAKALLTMKLDWMEVTSKLGVKTFEMVAYESKTKHIADGKWIKYIRRHLTQEAIIRAKERGWQYLYDQPRHSMYLQLREGLKDLYRHLGKTNEYFYEHSVHTLRHVGAHYWLRRTNYNYGIVAKIGGWHIIDELKRSYGEMPSDILFEVLDKASAGLNEV